MIWIYISAAISILVVIVWLIARWQNPAPLISRVIFKSTVSFKEVTGRSVPIGPADGSSVRFRRWKSEPSDPTVTNIRPVYMRMQERAGRIVMRRLEAGYLPGLCVQYLKNYDARYAIAAFFKKLGLQYIALLNRSHPQHHDQKRRFHHTLGILLEVEHLARDSRLSPEPIYALLSTDPLKAEGYVDRFRKATVIEREIEFPGIVFPIFQELRKEASIILEHWNSSPEEEFAGIYDLVVDYRELQRRFDSTAEIAANDATLIASHFSELATEVAAAFDAIIEAEASCRQSVLTGATVPADGIARLEELCAELRAIRDHLRENGRAKEPPRMPPDRHHYLNILELVPTATEKDIKSAYRRLARRYHPDFNPGDGTAEEKFKQVQAAYDALLKGTV